jgi:hypothetical protein
MNAKPIPAEYEYEEDIPKPSDIDNWEASRVALLFYINYEESLAKPAYVDTQVTEDIIKMSKLAKIKLLNRVRWELADARTLGFNYKGMCKPALDNLHEKLITMLLEDGILTPFVPMTKGSNVLIHHYDSIGARESRRH